MKILIIIFSLFLDFLLSNINYSLLSYFYPMITITTIVYLSNLYTNPNRSNYYLLVFLTSIIYDSIFVGNLLITVSSFMIVAILNMFLKRHLRSNLFNNILMLIVSIILYEVFILLLLFVYSLTICIKLKLSSTTSSLCFVIINFPSSLFFRTFTLYNKIYQNY